MDIKSLMGYQRNSPYRGNPFIDINTPEGLIDMSSTDIPLLGVDETGFSKILPPGSGMHKFRGTKVREIPMKQMGGLTQQDLLEFIFSDDTDQPVTQSPVEEQTVQQTSQGPDVRALQNEQDYQQALDIALSDYTPRSSRRQPRNLNFAAKATNDSAQFAFQYYQGKGLEPHVAAGIVGNLMQESGLNPYAKGDNGKATGIAQWHPDRFKGLKKWANTNNRDPYALETQLDYVLQEPGESQKALQALSGAKDSGEAAALFDKIYERSAGLHTRQRVGYARSLHPYKYGGKIK